MTPCRQTDGLHADSFDGVLSSCIKQCLYLAEVYCMQDRHFRYKSLQSLSIFIIKFVFPSFLKQNSSLQQITLILQLMLFSKRLSWKILLRPVRSKVLLSVLNLTNNSQVRVGNEETGGRIYSLSFISTFQWFNFINTHMHAHTWLWAGWLALTPWETSMRDKWKHKETETKQISLITCSWESLHATCQFNLPTPLPQPMLDHVPAATYPHRLRLGSHPPCRLPCSHPPPPPAGDLICHHHLCPRPVDHLQLEWL